MNQKQIVQRLYKQCMYTARSYAPCFDDYRQYCLEIRQRFDANKNASNPNQLVQETRDLLRQWAHPIPYRYPSSPGGTLEDRNAPLPKMIMGNYKD